ncbi:MAG: TRAP transporter substrate-binding protein [Candidatus Eremiobacteraeota bacterium]|nr:TRAP transporter substrate-binding protein [Candidatus Eremiobacteraeota bacterium]
MARRFSRRRFSAAIASGIVASGFPNVVRAQTARTLTFAHVNPQDTLYGVVSIEFARKLNELSAGSLKAQIYPSGQLGQEEELAQKIRTGDVDIAICSTANTSSVCPQAGVFSLEFLYANEAAMLKSVQDPGLNATFKKMIAETVSGAMSLGLFTQGARNICGKTAVQSVQDVKGKKIRVQATRTEDAFMSAYGAIPTHIPFGQVYTALQTGVVQLAENGNNIIVANKWYEVAPALSLTEHEANNSHLFVSVKTWQSLTADQQKWLVTSYDGARRLAATKMAELNNDALAKLRTLGVQVVANVNKASFTDIARPLVDSEAKGLGPYAEQLLRQVRAISK